jgi:signal transduction histidine kinase
MRAGKVRAWRSSGWQLPWLTFLVFMFWTGLSAQPALQPVRVLTQAYEIRRLMPEEAARAFPVRILGVVTDDVPEPDFFVQDKRAAPQVKRWRSVSSNSPVRITGVCLVRSGGLWSVAQSLRMLLRSAQDIVVLQAPSWWSLHHPLWVLSIAVGALLTVLIWAAVLGKRPRNQVVGIRQRPQNWAVLEERNRIARELHDTLEQELTAITMQLDLVADCFQHRPRAAQQALDTARSMSRHCMVEARRSVWDLRCHLLEHGDLASALERVVEPLVPQNDTRVDVRVDGRPVRLHASIEMNLLRIGQEAVANAIKHSLARNIAVELRYAPDSVRLEITDDGRGFIPDETPAGHFGLLDMRERAQCMDSWLYVESEPGMGTSISVEVPITCGQLRDEELKADTYSGR